MNWPTNTTSSHTIGIGFGTAGLGDRCYAVVTEALAQGFRKFDTAEASYWYDQRATGQALKDFFVPRGNCSDLRVSTKIPPWSLTSEYDIRKHAADSRQELVGFCPHVLMREADGSELILPYPLDVYYIHAPRCWPGWHPECNHAPETLNLYDSWLAMEAIVGLDRTAHRIGLSNVHPPELRELIEWIQQRQNKYQEIGSDNYLDDDGRPIAPPRLPDVLQSYADPIEPAEELKQLCDEYGIEFVSYSTLGTQHSMRRGGRNPVLTHPVVESLSVQYERSTAEIVLQWARQKGMSVIPRSSKAPHIQELARLLPESNAPSFELTTHDMLQMDTIKGSI